MDMLKNILQVNTRVSVADNYESIIKDVQPQHVVIALPDKHGQGMPLAIGEELHITALTGQGRFGFDSTVLGLNGDTITISIPSKSSREQLRQAFRVPVAMNVNVNVRTSDSVAQGTACIDDISAGGCRIDLEGMLSLSDTLVSGTLLDIDFAGTALELATVQAKIIRLIEKQVFSVEFVDIDERKRELIARYIFQRQLKLRDLLG